MNIYHRFINLPVEIPKPESFNRPIEKSFIDFLGPDVVPADFKDWLQSLGLTISNVIEGFYSAPNGGAIPPHTDTVWKPFVNDPVKINITWGPQNSVTRWWEVNKDENYIEVVHEETGLNFFEEQGIVPDIDCHKCYSADEKNLKLVYEKVISKPSLLNVGQLHSTYNPDTEQGRWTLSYVPLKDGKFVPFSEGLEIFKPWIEE